MTDTVKVPYQVRRAVACAKTFLGIALKVIGDEDTGEHVRPDLSDLVKLAAIDADLDGGESEDEEVEPRGAREIRFALGELGAVEEYLTPEIPEEVAELLDTLGATVGLEIDRLTKAIEKDVAGIRERITFSAARIEKAPDAEPAEIRHECSCCHSPIKADDKTYCEGCHDLAECSECGGLSRLVTCGTCSGEALEDHDNSRDKYPPLGTSRKAPLRTRTLDFLRLVADTCCGPVPTHPCARCQDAAALWRESVGFAKAGS